MTNPIKDITWQTPAGNSYKYDGYLIGTKFANVGGNYIYAHLGTDGRWYAVYIGQTNDLGARLANHEKQACAIKNGATHIFVRANSTESSRLKEEAELVQLCQPKCNDLLK